MFRKLKSPETSIYSTFLDLDNRISLLLTEQRHQRADLATIKRQLHTLINDDTAQKQVDDFYGKNAPLEDMAQDGNSSS